MFIVYHIKNTINNKGYIGYTGRTLTQRWKSHISASKKSKCRFHHALKKYGPDPWILLVLFETEDVNEAKKYENTMIENYQYMNKQFGYNAKPGGCGGWIVPENKKEQWIEKLKKNNTGSKNNNCLSITNEEIKLILLDFVIKNKYYPSLQYFVKYGLSIGKKIPKHFTKYRFNGSFKNLIKEIEEITQIKYEYTKERKNNISLSLKKYYKTHNWRKKVVKN